MSSAAPQGQARIRLGTARIDGEPLLAQLRPWRRRLILQQVLTWTGRGAIVGFSLALLVLSTARLLPWAAAPYWAFGIGVTCIVVTFGAALWFRPSLARTTRLVDTLLSLHDRLSTAWEMRNENAPLFGLQRRDALKQLGKHSPRTAVSLRPQRSNLIIAGIVVVLLALLLLLPNPMTALLQQQAAFQARIAKQIAAIEHVRSVTLQQANMPATERAQIDQILRELQTKLQNAQNQAQAQQAIAEAQAQLNQLRDPQAANKAQAQLAASSALQDSHNTNLSAIGQALAKNDSKGLADALKNLAAQVSKMTPAQRAQLAQQLEQAANQAQQNPNLSAALHQLARSERVKGRHYNRGKAAKVDWEMAAKGTIPAVKQGRTKRSLCQGRLAQAPAHKAMMAATASCRTVVPSHILKSSSSIVRWHTTPLIIAAYHHRSKILFTAISIH